LRLQNAYYYWSQLRDVILAITNVDGLIVAKDSSFSPSPPHRAAPRSIPLSSPHQSHRRGRLRRHARRGWPRSSPAEATSAAALSEDGPALRLRPALHLRAPPLYSAPCSASVDRPARRPEHCVVRDRGAVAQDALRRCCIHGGRRHGKLLISGAFQPPTHSRASCQSAEQGSKSEETTSRPKLKPLH
jgi:hypothetical protein